MKNKLSLLGMASLAAIVLSTTGGSVYAEETTPEGDLDYANSAVKVQINKPNIGDVDTLAFKDVPDIFDFGLKDITPGQVNVTSDISLKDTKVSVYKSYVRNDGWQVKASVSDLSDGKNSYEVSSFKLNNQEISKTGSNTVILKSDATNNGVGTYSYDISSASINCKLPTNIDKGISTLQGNVFYTLEVTSAAE